MWTSRAAYMWYWFVCAPFGEEPHFGENSKKSGFLDLAHAGCSGDSWGKYHMITTRLSTFGCGWLVVIDLPTAAQELALTLVSKTADQITTIQQTR